MKSEPSKSEKKRKTSENANVKMQHISWRLSASLILTVTVLTAIATTAIYFRAIKIEDNALHAKADEYIAYIIGAVEIPLWEINANSVQLIGKIFSQNELIIKLVIKDDTGAFQFSMEKDHGEDWVSRSGKVFHEGGHIGDVELWVTKKIYRQNSRKILYSHIIGAFFILFCLWLSLGVFIRLFLRKPLNGLNEIVNRYAAGQYDSVEDQIPYREFEPFGKILNQMGRRINVQLKSLQNAEQKYRTIFENAVEGIYQATLSGRMRNANPALATILGYDSANELVEAIDDAKHQLYVDPSHRDELIRRLEQHGSESGFETQLYKKDNSIIWVLINARAFTKRDEGIVYIEGFLTDISDRKKADKELRQHRDHLEELVAERTEELAQAKEQAEAANAAKSDFLARMSHEIRTPLNAVTGLTQVVLKSELTIDQRDYLNKVLLASKNLLNVINDILDFSKVEAGQMQLARTVFDLEDVLEHLTDLFSNRTSAKDLELIFAVSPQSPRQFIGDASRLIQVLSNLIENAIKFTQKGEIVVGVDAADKVDSAPGQTGLRFRVSDTGIGIGADVLPILFDPFTQADSSLTRQHEGTGLGLAICRRFVELMGGRIWAESTPGQGSTFYFTVLLESKKQTKPRFTVPEDLKGLRALVVDDSPTARQTMSDLLASFNFQVATADSGADAIEMLRSAPADSPYQLVLMDWKMPEMDGIEAARRINALAPGKAGSNIEISDPAPNEPASGYSDPTRRSQPPLIIMVTAFGHKMLKTRFDSSAVETWLTKPVKPSQLFNTIMELMGRKDAIQIQTKGGLKADHIQKLKGGRVLVVEDSELNLTVTAALLKDAGLYAEVAQNGRIAVEMVTAKPWKYFDAVLMDIQMPVMDGYESTRRIRQWERQLKSNPPKTGAGDADLASKEGTAQEKTNQTSYLSGRLPIIALTAHALSGEKEKCLSAGMDDYLSKPIDEKKLYQALMKWTTHKGATMDMKVPQEPLVPSPDSEKLDVKGALKRLGGRTQLYNKVVQRFVPECSRAHETITRQLAEGDMATASRTAHTVKGAAAAIGAVTLSRAAEDVEKHINDRQSDLKPYLMRFDEVMNSTLALISEYLDHASATDTAFADWHDDTSQRDQPIEHYLKQLSGYLKEGDMRAAQTWALSKSHFEKTDVDVSPFISDFDNAMERLDFDHAAQILNALLKAIA